MDRTPVSHVTKGLAVSVVIIIFSIVIIKTGQLANPGLGIVPIAFALLSSVLGTLLYASQMKGNVTFKDVFIHGFKMTTLVAAMVGFWIAISLKFNVLNVFDLTVESARNIKKLAGMNHEDIERELADYKNGIAPMSAIMNVVMYIFIGAIGSLIGAAFSKKNPGYTPAQKHG